MIRNESFCLDFVESKNGNTGSFRSDQTMKRHSTADEGDIKVPQGVKSMFSKPPPPDSVCLTYNRSAGDAVGTDRSREAHSNFYSFGGTHQARAQVMMLYSRFSDCFRSGGMCGATRME